MPKPPKDQRDHRGYQARGSKARGSKAATSKTGDSQADTFEAHSVPTLDDVREWPCLTIVHHPDLRRIGERAMLGAMLTRYPIEISRNHPRFSHPDIEQPRSLRDRFVSRKPVRLHLIGGDQVVDIRAEASAHIRVDGHPVAGSIKIPYMALESGVLLEMARRVVLALHLTRLGERIPGLGLVGESDEIGRVKQKIAQVADLEVPVLILGETGVGKERVAQSIHAASPRRGAPCVAINMAAINPTTAASELFGHARGAFTGATTDHVGLFERANGGTLFLDEVGETPLNIQAMLLRTLAEKTILPVGDQVERPVDVRIIAATDAKIDPRNQRTNADGSFRAALFHRLSGFEIRVPPLRERRVDIGRLALHFLSRELKALGELDRLQSDGVSRTMWFPTELMLRLHQHDWPGNVRQLSNVVRQLVICNRGAEALEVDESVERVLQEEPRSKSQLLRESARQDRGSRDRGSSPETPRERSQHEPDTGPVKPGDPGPADLRPDAGPGAADEPGPAVLTAPVNPDVTHFSPSDLDPVQLANLVHDVLRESQWSVGAAARKLDIPRTTLLGIARKDRRIRWAKDLSADAITRCARRFHGDITKMASHLQVSPRSLKLRITELGLDWENL